MHYNEFRPPFSNLYFGTWSEVSSGRVLQGADSTHSADSTIEAGLPNITGHLNLGVWDGVSGDFKADSKKQVRCAYLDKEYINSQSFYASRSSTIYGSSDTVQPPAYIVHIWKRVS